MNFTKYLEVVNITKDYEKDNDETNSKLDNETLAFFRKHNINVDDLITTSEDEDDQTLFDILSDLKVENLEESHNHPEYGLIVGIKCYTKPFPIVIGNDNGYIWYVLTENSAKDILPII